MMNPFIMSSSDVLSWYKPKTEMEEYLIELMRINQNDSIDSLKDNILSLNEEILDLLDKIDYLDSDVTFLEKENVKLRQKLQKYRDIELLVEKMNGIFNQNP